ncbi:hypothetical protein OG782_29795 [Streptomyces sp. NBC_00876]|uniref:hypothetical protein n=1 Tax=Streptomyces sp. NBC_00876 TaxID=2975853 RepID=UPI00386488E9|nr:hypothetical protein OG782_29795 [Streptomyces sp. NBC_00876]
MNATADSARVAVVAECAADAAVLVGAERAGGSVIGVICLRDDGGEGRAALDRALADASGRGCRVAGAPRFVDGQGEAGAAGLLKELRALRPQRIRIPDPDPVHADWDTDLGRPVYDEPADRAAAALLALRAAREFQLESSAPVLVDCRRHEAATAHGAAASCPRYPAVTGWLAEGFDGRSTAFLPSAAGVLRWTQLRQHGTAWDGPELLPGPRLMPGLRVVRDFSGLAHLLALRRTARKDGGEDVEIVHAAQYRTGHPLTPWHSLGSPNAGDAYKSRETGFPAAGFDAAGGFVVFARNFGHSVSFREQRPEGAWSPWRHLSGVRVADELVTVTTPKGEVELLARTRDSAAVVRWYRPGYDAEWAEDRGVPFAPRPGSMAAGPEPGTVVFRDLRTNEPCLWQLGSPAPVPLGGDGGEGPVTGVRGVEADGWNYSLLVRPDAGGSCAVGAFAEGRPDAGVWWNTLGGAEPYGVPAAVRDRTGMITVATVTAAAELSVANRESRTGGFEFGPWHSV